MLRGQHYVVTTDDDDDDDNEIARRAGAYVGESIFAYNGYGLR